MLTTHERLTAALADRYRLERELGAGGMATVHLAHDLKHDRQVAIKVLRPELAAVIGAERFLSEIKTTANLQHPHILPLFDSGAADGFLFYVMPLVEGESLRERLHREKQLPIVDAVRIATEIAGALDYAHRHGVIHRDIKPENILLHDGRALVADFGIALAASKAGGTRLTETGMSLGTPAYMSPEQAMGEREITARSDVYALGCVTYEMLVGEPPFTGPTAQAIVAKVMTAAPPPPSDGRARVPAHVDAAVRTALEKVPADRFSTAAEFATALAHGPSATAPTRSVPTATRAAPRGWIRPALLAGAAALAVAGAFVAGRRAAPSSGPALPPSRLALLAPQLGGRSTANSGRGLAISPDGEVVVYVSRTDSGSAQLLLHRLDAPDPVPIPGSAGLLDPTFTPDGRSIVATSATGGVRISIGGGTPRRLSLPASRFGGAWSPTGDLWFGTVGISELLRLTPTESLTPAPFPSERQAGLRVQQVLDDGRSALAVAAPASSFAGPGLLVDLQSGERTTLLEGPLVQLYLSQGELIAVLPDGSVTATPFDERAHRVRGPAVRVATGVALNSSTAEFAVARNGTMAYVHSAPPSLVLVRADGTAETLLSGQANLHAPQFSPDGRSIAFDMLTPEGRDVWRYGLDQRIRTRVTFERDGHDATWAPDGRSILFTSFKSGVHGIYRLRPGSTAPAESVLASSSLLYTGRSLRSDGSIISLGTDLRPGSSGDVVRIGNGGRGPIEPIVASRWLERYGMPSPDERWLAFTSDQSGREEVYVQSLSGTGVPVQVSSDGGTEPVWAPNGREVYYRGYIGDRFMLMAAALQYRPDLAVVGHRVLFPATVMRGTGPHANYDVSPDGRTFVMVHEPEAQHVVVIQNLPELLRRLRSAEPGTQ
jgi:serine/threonine-protein kinase